MNKRIIALLSALCCFVLLSAFLGGCTKVEETPEEREVLRETGGVVTFARVPGVRFVSEIRSGEALAAGSEVSFTIERSSFYEGSPTVTVNGEAVEETDGVYKAIVSGDMLIDVNGISLKDNSITGEGTMADDPFVLTTPIDLLYVAQRVNAGDAAYIGAYYSLDADIDFGGEELEIIGDGLTESAYFEGYFNGQGHVISNYVINSDGRAYVGLFGILQVNLKNSQGGTIYDLTLKDYTITVKASDATVFCGSFAGYGIGANLILCNAENGKIDVYGDVNNFTYTGGIFGYQQGYDNGVLTYISSVAYCTSSVDIDCFEGAVYSAGGITGYLSQSTGKTPASINNSYSTGNIQGAMLSGGIAGYVSENTCIVNCYSSGLVSSQSSTSDTDNSEQFCHTYAGGIAALARPDSIIAESFSAGKVYSKSSLGSYYEHAGGVLGKASEVSEGGYASYPATVYSCLSAHDGIEASMLKDKAFLEEKLNWNECDWVYNNDTYPEINTEEHSDYAFDITFEFYGSDDLKITDFDAYMPMSFWYLEDILPSSLTGGEGNTQTSYCYYFDTEHTLPIPDSYVPTHNMTVYAATADYSEVAGEYLLHAGSSCGDAKIVLYTDGNFTYTDGATERSSRYKYNGESILLLNTRLARYSSYVEGINSYELSDFTASVRDGALVIVGGVIYDDSQDAAVNAEALCVAFPEDTPLIAYPAAKVLSGAYCSGGVIYTFSADSSGYVTENGRSVDFTYVRDGNTFTMMLNGNETTGTVNGDAVSIAGVLYGMCDAYAGSWSVDSKANKVFTFDGAGSWYYEYYGFRAVSRGAEKIVYENLAGTYTVSADGVMTLSGGMSGVAEFVSDTLCISVPSGTYECHRMDSFLGTWVYPEYNLTLNLYGIGKSGEGKARLEYLYSDETVEFYDMSYSFDNLRNGVICLYYGEEVFGYMNYVSEKDTLSSTLYVGPLASFMQNVPLYRVDDLVGEWISDNSELPLISFNGYGTYSEEKLSGMVLAGESEIPYKLDEATLSGSFMYKDKVYVISYSEERNILSLTSTSSVFEYQRKDAFASLTLHATDDSTYSFDGRGALLSGGIMTVTSSDGNESTYKYSLSADGAKIYKDGKDVGALTKGEKAYMLSLDGEHELGIRSEFTGTWAMSGSLENLVIGDMDLAGNMNGKINGKETVFSREDDHLVFQFNDSTFYIIKVGEKNLVVSQMLAWYQSTYPIYCALVDDIFGTWENSLGASYEFDGMSGSTITNGTAQSKLENGTISFYYRYNDNGWYVLWSEIDGETKLFRLNMCDVDTRRAFINGNRAFTVEEGDNLYNTTFLDKEANVEYAFDGFGKVKAGDDATYDYKLINLNQNTGSATVEITVGSEIKKATLDFSTADNFTISFVDVGDADEE